MFRIDCYCGLAPHVAEWAIAGTDPWAAGDREIRRAPALRQETRRCFKSLPDGKAFKPSATSIPHALTILRATEALVGSRGHVWIKREGERLDADQLRRDQPIMSRRGSEHPPGSGLTQKNAR